MADVGSATIARELGYSQRGIRTLAAAGKLPSAYRLTDTSEWRFELDRVRAWKRQREEEIKRSRSIAETKSRRPDISMLGGSSGDRVARVIAERLKALREMERLGKAKAR